MYGTQAAFERATEFIKAHGLKIYRICIDDGEGIKTLEFERTNRCNDTYSVSKAFTMTAAGILCDRGMLAPDTVIGDVFKKEIASYGDCDPKWDRITLDDVMRHRIGYEYPFLNIDIDVLDPFRLGSPDFLHLILKEKITGEPGISFAYSDSAFYLVSRAVTKLTGEKLDDFLLRELFVPLEFREFAWAKCPEGYPMGGTGLYVSTSDMTKLGRLYLDRGVYGGQRILSENWIDTVLSRSYEFGSVNSGKGYAKGGMNGQMLYFSYRDNISVAWQGCEPSAKSGAMLELF